MQKTKFISFILLCFATLFLSSCVNYERSETVKYSENITNESRHFDEEFDKINASSGIEVIIEQSNETEVTIITNEDFHDKIKTRVEDGTLYISSRSTKSSFSIFGYKSNRIQDSSIKKVIVKMPIISAIEANSASKIENKGILRGNAITLNASSASEIKLHLEFDRIEAESNSASKIELEGMALDLNANASSASKIEADDLLVNTIIAESSSASEIKVHPIVNLKANASSAGEIKYNNNPKQIEKESNSGGNIFLE
ncbi:MAG: head GIN domain-containing protein [Flavobacterium sp.]